MKNHMYVMFNIVINIIYIIFMITIKPINVLNPNFMFHFIAFINGIYV